ncbi:uncharacterized protein LOC131671366 [Phymastichus coffea]|uniref:uncharacterized protein LOC131671366 n=1 Tax=Phymastichus coffea TaxID=108790 RepID=UPI00273A914B|nr:uncharacterized protein LOC131671366 [Phymastichus coffea]
MANALENLFYHWIKVHRRRPRLLNIPKGVHPFCKRVVGTVQQAPKICNGVSSFIVDATTSACSESFREICRLAIGTSYGCQPIIKKICPSRDAVEKKIKQAVNKSCENSVQKVINQFGKVTSDVNKNAVCDAFVEVVREVCHKTITKFCDDLRSLFQTPCTDFLPGIICD